MTKEGVTALKATQAQLRDSEEKLAVLRDNLAQLSDKAAADAAALASTKTELSDSVKSLASTREELAQLTAKAAADAATLATTQADLIKAQELREVGWDPVHARDKFGSTALHWAAYRDNGAAAQRLLDAGVDMEAKDKVG